LETSVTRDESAGVPLKESRLQEILDSTSERTSELLGSAIQLPLTDSGVYVGTIIWHRKELLPRISPANRIFQQGTYCPRVLFGHVETI
jgi:hypothetical protein